MRQHFAIAIFTGLVLAGGAAADPCTAVPDSGPTPAHLKPGARFSGPVTYVGDGDSLCVGMGASNSTWVEVRLSDFFAPELSAQGGAEARDTLEQLVRYRRADCIAEGRTHDRIAARCTVDGRSIGAMMRAAGIGEGGNGRKGPPAVAAEAVPSSGRGAFRNCAEARAAGAAPLYRGQPGYGAHMDGDGDGIACEPYRRR
ncbi:thermonuclease family protein [Phenylobacterium sp.]|uniref:thermonuclease family protein n=1 Tax=Phenylobacterium sp. TaxID=1871053 RepID=UPI0035AFE8E9